MDGTALATKATALVDARAEHLTAEAALLVAQALCSEKVGAMHDAYVAFLAEAQIDYPPP